MAYTMTPIRRKEIKRVKALLKRLENRGYNISIDFEKIHTNKLKHINRVNAVGTYAKYNPLRGAVIERRKKAERKRKREAKKAERAKKISEGKISVIPSPPAVFKSSSNAERDAAFELSKVYAVIEDGIEYSAKYLSTTAMIHNSTRRIRDIFNYAVENHGAEKVLNAIKENYGDIEKFSKQVERLCYAVYDEVYGGTKNGSEMYERDILRLTRALDSVDLGF